MTDYDQIARDVLGTPPLSHVFIGDQFDGIYLDIVRIVEAALRTAHEAGVAAERERCVGVALREAARKRRWMRKVDRIGLHNGGALAEAKVQAAEAIAAAIRKATP